MTMKATRHNGRAGKHGAYNPKHNDRQFDLSNSEHIDMERAKGNVYWDVYQGFFTLAMGVERKYTFEEVEKAFYFNNYQEHVEAQNERNEKGHHPERNRTTNDVLTNVTTCPEETVLQLGNIDETVAPSVLAEVAAEYFEKFNARFGSHVHILDWALHLDETTPHIHERHVFDAKNKYGELCPWQDKALEELGFERPDLTKPKSKTNNRKVSFDAECRKMFLDIAQKHGLDIDLIPEYGGASYLEKTEYILEKLKRQNKELTAANENLEQENEQLRLKNDEMIIKLDDVDALINEVTDIAYDKAVEVLTGEISDAVRKEDIAEIEKIKAWLSSNERKAPQKAREYAIAQLTSVQNKLLGMADKVLGKVKNIFTSPDKKKQVTEQIVKHERISLVEKLAEAKQKMIEREAQLEKGGLRPERHATKGEER